MNDQLQHLNTVLFDCVFRAALVRIPWLLCGCCMAVSLL
jgi:hypothetical protein